MDEEKAERAERSVILFLIMGVFLFFLITVLYVVVDLSIYVSVGVACVLVVIGTYWLLKKNKKD